MEKPDFFINSTNLEYSISEQRISNQFKTEDSISETPSVFYLNLKYEDEIYLPVTLFKNRLTPLQIIVKYLKENLHKTNKQIALLLNRDPKTIWVTYRSVQKKKAFVFEETDIQVDIQVPLSIFRDRRLSILEALVHYLKNLEMKYSEIARILNKDQRTVWTVHSRAKKKFEKNKKDESKK
ncbi:hypothetical protein AYK26_03940 [Euryarchaeota archaeon SM23-78]|nr:MAG: hypothetical protein AYK26_03940 [Euryarchaeota archaeon SM23-78]MBW3001451.1 hypothetical protein [Candidatus Woesearchaeota archaeon]